MNKYNLLTGFVAGLCAIVGWELMGYYMKDSHAPARSHVECDAFDVDIHPHDRLSTSDADEFALELTQMRICRMSNQGSVPTDHGAEG